MELNQEHDSKKEEHKSIEDQWGEAFNEEKSSKPAAPEPPKTAPPAANVREIRPDAAKPASFGNLREEASGSVGNLEMILDIPVTISVEIGKTRMLIKDLLQLCQGAVVELEKLAGEPMEILVNGKLLARGEAVVVNEKFGVKLTDIVSPSERISRLK